jgi:hypothetical protein
LYEASAPVVMPSLPPSIASELAAERGRVAVVEERVRRIGCRDLLDVVVEAVAVEVAAHRDDQALADLVRVAALDEQLRVELDVWRVDGRVAVVRCERRVAPRAIRADLAERAAVRADEPGDQRVATVAFEVIGRDVAHGERLAEPVHAEERAAQLLVDAADGEARAADRADDLVDADAAPRLRRLRRTARDDVDDAEERVRAVHRRHRAANDLDACDLVDGDDAFEAEARRRAPRFVDRRAVDEHEDARVEVARNLQAADAERRVDAVVLEVDTGDAVDGFADGAVTEPADAVGRDDRDGRRDVAEALLALRGADDDFFLGARRGEHGRGRRHVLVGGWQRRQIRRIDRRLRRSRRDAECKACDEAPEHHLHHDTAQLRRVALVCQRIASTSPRIGLQRRHL